MVMFGCFASNASMSASVGGSSVYASVSVTLSVVRSFETSVGAAGPSLVPEQAATVNAVTAPTIASPARRRCPDVAMRFSLLYR
jgi:hypothetical protein